MALNTRGLRAALALALAACAGAPLATHAAPAPVAGAAQPFRIGAFKAFALRDALNVLPNDGKVFGVGRSPAEVAAALRAAGAPTDAITLGVDALLVVGQGRVMLFDTGLGPGVHGALMQSLAQAGVAPTQVTDVFVTHSHGDHVGGLAAADGALAFPNATVRMSAAEWAWMRTHEGQAKLVALIAPEVATFSPGAQVAPGVTAVALPGHTPGHVGYRIRSGGADLFDIGDLAHSAVLSLGHPGWAIGYDADRAQGARTRQTVLPELAASGERVFAPHFPYPGVGRIVRRGDGFALAPALP